MEREMNELQYQHKFHDLITITQKTSFHTQIVYHLSMILEQRYIKKVELELRAKKWSHPAQQDFLAHE